jgi:alanyl-tRNA synthetase
MTLSEIRTKWLDFFKSKNHDIFEPKSLIPVNDNSILWINSGVATLKSYFSGEINPDNPRIANSQSCVRTNDIDIVGTTSRHHTFFEMLGNFSIGEYFKSEAIEFAYEFLTHILKLDSDKFYITVYKDDEEAYNKWLELGISTKRIIKNDKDRNFWDLGSGPCGPCTEIFYDRGEKYDPNNVGEELFVKDIENDRYVEIWNIVFSQYNNDGNNNYTELKRKNIDTGAGLERIASIIQNVPTNFDTDLFQKIMAEISKYTDKRYDIDSYFTNNKEQYEINKAYKIIADHIRTVTFMLAEGLLPSNKDRGYIIRRLIRRSMIYSNNLGIKESYLSNLAIKTIDLMKDHFSYLLDRKEMIQRAIEKEEKSFSNTLTNGIKLLKKEADKSQKITGEIAFRLLDTFGYPIELTKEYCEKNNLELDLDKFNECLENHREISRVNKKTKKINVQIPSLMEINDKFEFIRDKFEINAKVTHLFDCDFNEVKSLENSKGYLITDKTIFYATSGGQEHDIGYINSDSKVSDVFFSPNRHHIHDVNVVSKISTGDTVNLKIDERKRILSMKNHTCVHLTQAFLKNFVSQDIWQQGSHLNHEKFSFDFTYYEKISIEKLKDLEDWINSVINKDFPVETFITDKKGADEMNALAFFHDKYDEIGKNLRVVKISDFSTEVCGGTHVNNTKEIQKVKILNIVSKGSGIWRINGISSFETIAKNV